MKTQYLLSNDRSEPDVFKLAAASGNLTRSLMTKLFISELEKYREMLSLETFGDQFSQ